MESENFSSSYTCTKPLLANCKNIEDVFLVALQSYTLPDVKGLSQKSLLLNFEVQFLESKKVTCHTPGTHPRQSPYPTMKGFPLQPVGKGFFGVCSSSVC